MGFIHGFTFDYTKALRGQIRQKEIILKKKKKKIEKVLEKGDE